MNIEAFILWRKHMGFSQKRAAKELGCSLGNIQTWEDQRKKIHIPGFISMACAYLDLMDAVR